MEQSERVQTVINEILSPHVPVTANVGESTDFLSAVAGIYEDAQGESPTEKIQNTLAAYGSELQELKKALKDAPKP